jgi:hypothetical protein
MIVKRTNVSNLRQMMVNEVNIVKVGMRGKIGGKRG